MPRLIQTVVEVEQQLQTLNPLHVLLHEVLEASYFSLTEVAHMDYWVA